jgi:aspartate kinase
MRRVAERALASAREGNQVVVVVSAMSGETNRLLALAHEMAAMPDARELDVIASTGEQVSSALVAIAIQQLGGAAESLLGHQVRIQTDGAYTKARIKAIDASRIEQAFAAGKIAVLAGFQGVDEHGNITTLGRGGSDTTAVAVAAAIGADVCEIYTDVDGVYTTDPNMCPSARKIGKISYDEMLELASLGAKVLQLRSVEIAKKYGVRVHVRTSFPKQIGNVDVYEEGTWVVGESSELEEIVVSGVAYDRGDARVLVVGATDAATTLPLLFQRIAEKNVSVDIIVKSPSVQDARSDITFTLPKTDLARIRGDIEAWAKELGASDVRYDADIAKISVVGLGMRSHAGVAARMFGILAKEGIAIDAVSTSEIKVSCIVAAKYTELAVRALHDGFGLHVRGSVAPPAPTA